MVNKMSLKTGLFTALLMSLIASANAADIGFSAIKQRHRIICGVDVDYPYLAKKQDKDIVGFEGELYFNTSKPDGMFRKVMDVNKFNEFGWKPKYSLEEGLKLTYDWYLNNKKTL